jgi:hypothetical protein
MSVSSDIRIGPTAMLGIVLKAVSRSGASAVAGAVPAVPAALTAKAPFSRARARARA